MITHTATIDGAPALVQLINLAYRVEEFFVHGNRVTQEYVSAHIGIPKADFLVIDSPDSKSLIGAVYVEVRGDRGYFGLLSVDPSQQKQGLGRTLVNAAETYCRAAGCHDLEIEVVNLRTELPAFYAKFGFTPFAIAPFPHPGRLRQEAHLVLMTKSLVEKRGEESQSAA